MLSIFRVESTTVRMFPYCWYLLFCSSRFFGFAKVSGWATHFLRRPGISIYKMRTWTGLQKRLRKLVQLRFTPIWIFPRRWVRGGPIAFFSPRPRSFFPSLQPPASSARACNFSQPSGGHYAPKLRAGQFFIGRSSSMCEQEEERGRREEKTRRKERVERKKKRRRGFTLEKFRFLSYPFLR